MEWLLPVGKTKEQSELRIAIEITFFLKFEAETYRYYLLTLMDWKRKWSHCYSHPSPRQRKPLKWGSPRSTTRPCTPTFWTWRLARAATSRASSLVCSRTFSPLGPPATSKYLRSDETDSYRSVAAVESGASILQVGQEERSRPVEEEGPAEAARRASVFGQRPARGERPRPCFCPPLASCFFFAFVSFSFCTSLCFILTTLSVSSPHPSGHPFCFPPPPSHSHSRTLSACRVFVFGAAAPAVSWLLLALAVLQALSEIGGCGRGMCLALWGL